MPGTIGDGLHFEAVQECSTEVHCAVPLLLDEEGNSHEVDKISISDDGTQLDMSASTLTTKVFEVSYCKGDIPLLSVFNSEGIPLVPFSATPNDN